MRIREAGWYPSGNGSPWRDDTACPDAIEILSGSRRRTAIGAEAGADPAAAGRSDEALLERVGEGDEAALSALYDRYARPVYALALRVVRDREAAEDLTQEVFWRLWRHAGGYDPARGCPASWILGIAHHAALDELRRRRARPALAREDPGAARPLLEVSDGVPTPEELALGALRRVRVGELLGILPRSQRECVELAYFGGLTQAEIAEGAGVPLGTVKTRARRALRRLRLHLEERGVGADSL